MSKSQSKNEIPSKIMAKGKIVAGSINCLITKAKWTGSQSNRSV